MRGDCKQALGDYAATMQAFRLYIEEGIDPDTLYEELCVIYNRAYPAAVMDYSDPMSMRLLGKMHENVENAYLDYTRGRTDQALYLLNWALDYAEGVLGAGFRHVFASRLFWGNL